ncbi:MAG: hypothetical protein QW046_01485 [Candidatus Micrarchaeaceae archaeon]
MAEKREGKAGISLYFVEAKSITDIARHAYEFSAPRKIFVTASKPSKLFVFGERVGNTVIAPYIEMEATGSIIKYALNYGDKDAAEFTAMDNVQTNERYINVIKMDISGIRLSEIKPKCVTKIRVENVQSIIKMIALNSTGEDSQLGKVYAFDNKGRTVFGAFDIVEELEDEKRIFYYAESDKMEKNFAAYDYATDRVKFVEGMDVGSQLYVKIINLAEPLSFF